MQHGSGERSTSGNQRAVPRGLLVAGVVAPETGAGSVLAVAGPTGAELLAGSGTACGLLIKRVYDDARTIEDPPSGSLHKLARPAHPKGTAANLPSCSTFPAETLSYCESLRAAELRYLAALRGGELLSGALKLTASRISGAFRARDGGALHLQMRHAKALHSQMSANIAQERSAARALAQVVKGAQISVKLSAAQEGPASNEPSAAW